MFYSWSEGNTVRRECNCTIHGTECGGSYVVVGNGEEMTVYKERVVVGGDGREEECEGGMIADCRSIAAGFLILPTSAGRT